MDAIAILIAIGVLLRNLTSCAVLFLAAKSAWRDGAPFQIAFRSKRFAYSITTQRPSPEAAGDNANQPHGGD
jgi:hypothetical protein